MAVRLTGDDDRETVEVDPRRDEGEGHVETSAPTRPSNREGPSDPVHAFPTQQLPLRNRPPTETELSKTTAASPVEAMRFDEIARTRVFVRVVLGVTLAGLVGAFATNGDPVALRFVILGCVLTGIGSVWGLRVTSDPLHYTPRAVLPPGLCIALGAFGGVYYWGCASPVAAMIAYGIYFFSLSAHARLTLGLYLLVAVLHALLCGAIIAGLVVDRGIVSMGHMGVVNQLGVLIVIEFLYFITFFTARISQRVTLGQMSRLEQAVRGVAHREALLAEARAELDRALKVGSPGRYTDQVVGSFRLGVVIGRGGMGEVYEAASMTDRREAAVKLLHPGTLADPTQVERFMREARIAARIDCPNVVQVLEVGMTSGEVPFLVMERLRGHDLAHQLRRQRRLSLAQARQLGDHIAAGLEAARQAAIVHRDLKPHNVFLAEDPDGSARWKILDFGVSKAGGSGTLTRGHVIGTPAYMAPEQARGEDVDHRADVYSLAAILYRAVTGHPAFTGKDVPSTLFDVVFRVPTQPSLLAMLPGDIDRVLALGLAKDAAERFATALELAQWFALAVYDGLGSPQRRRADELIARQPWGMRAGAGPTG